MTPDAGRTIFLPKNDRSLGPDGFRTIKNRRARGPDSFRTARNRSGQISNARKSTFPAVPTLSGRFGSVDPMDALRSEPWKIRRKQLLDEGLVQPFLRNLFRRALKPGVETPRYYRSCLRHGDFRGQSSLIIYSNNLRINRWSVSSAKPSSAMM